MSRRPPPGGVVVGVNDGSSARGAVTWAARTARARGLPLVVCHAYRADEASPDRELACAARNRALRTARYGVEVAEAAAPGVTAVAWAAEGAAAQVLVDACFDPALFVVGFRARGQLAAQVLATFVGRPQVRPCPVAAVPPRFGGLRRISPSRRRSGRTRGPVVAVVMGDDRNRDVLRVAATEADLRGARMVEVPARPSEVLLRRELGEPLSAVTKHADLLVVGMPVEAAPEFLRGPGRAASTSGCGVPLAAVLGYGAFRRFGPPVLLVPIVSRHGDSAGSGEPLGSGAGARRSVQLGEADRLAPTRHRW